MEPAGPVAAAQIQFIRLESGQEKALLKLLIDLYAHLGWSAPYFDWQYHANPAGRAQSWAALRGNEMIGNFTAIPFEMHVKGNVCKGWRIQDVLTRPAYAGLGVYLRLSSLANQLLKSEDYPLNFAFPNERSHSGFIKQGWFNGLRIPLWVLENMPSGAEIPKGEFKPLSVFGKEAEKIWSAHAKRVSFALHRSADFLNWRYLARPGAEYFPFHVSLGSDELILIMKFYHRQDGTRWAHICDFFQSAGGPALYEQGIRHALQFAKARNCKALSCWQPGGGEAARLLERFQFIRQQDLNRWLVLNANGRDAQSGEWTQEKNWHLAMGDSDVY